MKRVVSTILLVILLTSMLCSAFKIMPAGLGSAMRVVAFIQNSWNISTNLVRGELYHSHIQQGLDWSLGYFEEDERYPGFEILYVEANITDPQNNQTIFVITMGKASGFLAILDINLTLNGGGLDATPFYRNISNSYYEVGGIAQFDGNYTFQFRTFPDRNDPPVSIGIYNHLIWTTIYIRADGTIDPPDANISMVNSYTYVFTDDISGDIVVEKDNVVIDGGGHTLQAAFANYGIGIDLRRNNVTIKNTNIENFELGIKLVGFNNSIFWNNIINNSNCGIWLQYSSSGNSISGNNITNNYYGIMFYSSSGNSISGNTITNNMNGIVFHDYSNYNSISGNNIAANNWAGIWLEESLNNNISGNNIIDNDAGIWFYDSPNIRIVGNIFVNDGLWGEIHDCPGSVIEDNQVNGKPLVYLEDVSDVVVENAGQVMLANCDRMRVENLNISNATVGVYLMNTNNTIISGNSIAKNAVYGILLDFYSSNNNITWNNITNNGAGIELYSSSNISIFHNNFINNAQQAYSIDSVNVWDDGYPSGGNYWSNYADFDLYSGPNQDELGSDGIWDHPYVIDADNQDNYPLVGPWPPVPQLWGVIVGVGEYVNFPDLILPANDAQDVYSQLISSGWDASHLRLLTDGEATKANIETAVNWMETNAGSNDLCLFFFSGHGTYSTEDLPPDTELDGHDEYILPTDALEGSADSAIRDDEFATWLRDIAGTKVVILDSCYSGGFINDLEEPGYVVLTACEENGLSKQEIELQHGVFTFYILEGLARAADADRNSEISAEEIFSYVSPRVVEHLAQQGEQQVPQLYDGVSGEVMIAWLIPGDINNDATVDIFDCVIVALAFSSTPGDSNWNPVADINNDGIVDIFDIVVVALHFGETG